MKKAAQEVATVTKTYIDNSGNLFNFVIKAIGLKNDAALSVWLGVAPLVVSRVRHGSLFIGAKTILLIHEKSGIPVAEIRRLIAGGEHV